MAVLVKSRVWPHAKYEPHNGQRQVHGSRARHRVVAAGRRWGKSKLGGHELLPRALWVQTRYLDMLETGERVYDWIVGPNYDDCEREWRVLWDAVKIMKIPKDHPGTYNNPVGGNMALSLWQGRYVVECRSADHPESLDGEGLSFALLVEAAKMKPSVWDKYIRPALADKRGASLATSTPEGRNWFYEHWRRGQDEAEFGEWESFRFPSWTNDRIFPLGASDPEILAMKADMTDARFAQEVGAEFSEFVGRVFKNFDEERHVARVAYNPDLPVFIAVDYGFTNPFVCLVLQVDVWDTVTVLAEYRRVGMTVNEIAAELKGWRDGLATRAVGLYADPAEPGSTRILETALRVRSKGPTGGRLRDRLDLIRKHLKLVPEHVPYLEREPKLIIDRSCTGLIPEMADLYRYPETRSELRAPSEEPLKKNDHGPEALGRFFAGRFGKLDRASAAARVSRASMGRRARVG